MWSVAPARVSWVSVVSRWIRAAEEDVSSSVLKVRMPISEPLAAIAFSESGFWMATEPSMKNVAGTRKCWSTASSSAVRSGCGPPSKVRATVAFLSAKVCTGWVRASTTCWPCVTTNGTCCTEGFSAGLFGGTPTPPRTVPSTTRIVAKTRKAITESTQVGRGRILMARDLSSGRLDRREHQCCGRRRRRQQPEGWG